MNRELDLSRPFNTPYFRDFYTGYRNKIEDLFESEKYFIHEFVAPKKSYLDIGCALGGLYEILTAIEPSIAYHGIDISNNMIQAAKENFPHVSFENYDGTCLPFRDSSFDRVLTLGTTVHDQNFEQLLKEAYRVARETIFFDMRLIHDQKTLNSLADAHVQDESGKYPYVIVNFHELIQVFHALSPKPSLVRGYGYFGTANKFTTLPPGYKTITLSTFLVYKSNKPTNEIKFDFKLPFSSEGGRLS